MSDLNETPRANRFTIGLFGNCNVGKSSLINVITNQQIAIVSEFLGTTTDPVIKAMEILPIGPVVLIDTPGLNDEGKLGELRLEKTYESLRKCDFSIFVTDALTELAKNEIEFINQLKKRNMPCICVINKCDNLEEKTSFVLEKTKKIEIPVVFVSAKNKKGIETLKEMLVFHAKKVEEPPSLLAGIVSPGDMIVLVTPIDSSAPKGRIILPQQQTIREILDMNGMCVVTKETELVQTLARLKEPPKLVITDSQVFKIVDELIPKELPLTSFSILFARQKGNLDKLIEGIRKIDSLTVDDTILIVEGCTHHRKEDDIGKVKIPKWLREHIGEGLKFEWVSGACFPKDISKYALIIHCGACMVNRKEMLYRIEESNNKGIKITNYGMLIAYLNGILERSMQIFHKELA